VDFDGHIVPGLRLKGDWLIKLKTQQRQNPKQIQENFEKICINDILKFKFRFDVNFKFPVKTFSNQVKQFQIKIKSNNLFSPKTYTNKIIFQNSSGENQI